MPNKEHFTPTSETTPPNFSPQPDDYYVEVYKGKRGLFSRSQYRARILSANGNIIFQTSEGYNNQMDLLNVVGRLFPHLAVEYV